MAEGQTEYNVKIWHLAAGGVVVAIALWLITRPEERRPDPDAVARLKKAEAAAAARPAKSSILVIGQAENLVVACLRKHGTGVAGISDCSDYGAEQLRAYSSADVKRFCDRILSDRLWGGHDIRESAVLTALRSACHAQPDI